MDKKTDPATPFARAFAAVEHFSEKSVAVLPERPSRDMIAHAAQITGEDADKLARLYQLFVSMGRLDKFSQELPSGTTGFAEE